MTWLAFKAFVLFMYVSLAPCDMSFLQIQNAFTTWFTVTVNNSFV